MTPSSSDFPKNLTLRRMKLGTRVFFYVFKHFSLSLAGITTSTGIRCRTEERVQGKLRSALLVGQWDAGRDLAVEVTVPHPPGSLRSVGPPKEPAHCLRSRKEPQISCCLQLSQFGLHPSGHEYLRRLRSSGPHVPVQAL